MIAETGKLKCASRRNLVNPVVLEGGCFNCGATIVGKFLSIRALVRFMVCGLILLLALLVTSIWWLPVALPSVLQLWDVEVDSVERLPSGRWQLAGLEYAFDGGRLAIGGLEGPSPQQYLWERFRAAFTEASLVDIESIQIKQRSKPAVAAKERASEAVDPVRVEEQLREILAEYGKWLPPMVVEQISVESEAGDEWRLLDLRLRALEMAVAVEGPRLPERLFLSLSLDPEEPWRGLLRAPDSAIQAELTLHSGDDQLDLRLNLRQGEASVEGKASFERGKTLPTRASLNSAFVPVDKRWVPPLAGWSVDAPEISDLDLLWEDGRYSGRLSLAASFIAEDEAKVPLKADLSLSGGLKKLRIDAFELRADFGQLQLMQPLEVSLADGSVSENASLKLEADLAKQPFFDASGLVAGRLRAKPSLSGGPNVVFELSASGVGYESYAVDQIDLSGRLQGDKLSVDQMELRPVPGSEQEVIRLNGSANLASEELELEYGLLVGADWVNARQDYAVFSDTLDVGGRIRGSFARPIVEGKVESLKFTYPGVVPISLAGSFRSEGMDRFSLDATASAEGAVINTVLEAELSPDQLLVDLKNFKWTDPERPSLELEAPTRIVYRYSGEAASPESRFSMSSFLLTGPELSIGGAWDPDSGLEFHLSNVSFQRIGHWLGGELPTGSVNSLSISLSDLRPRLIGSMEIQAEGRLPGEEALVEVDFAARFNSSGTFLERVQLMFAEQSLLRGSMELPVRFRIPASGGPFWNLEQDGSIRGELSGASNADFSDLLARRTKVRVDQAVLDFKMEGSLRKPTGLLDLQMRALSLPAAGLPPLERISLSAKATPDTLSLEGFECFLSESKIAGTLELPVDALVESIQGGDASRTALLARSSGSLELVDWRAEDWVDFLPPIMRRSGGLSASLVLNPELDLEGRLSFRDFALRPTSSLPSVDSIRGEIGFSDHRLEVRSASARVGGNPASLSGWVDMSDWKDPLWELSVKGNKIPLARTTDMILRSDLDLKASRTSRTESPLVSGELQLRSSTMLVDFDPLSPRVEGGPQAKPPYFSITEPGLADWRLDVTVAGDSFMRVRSPYFKTQLSANFKLSGTLEEPLLIGSARVLDAEFRFPGAKMRVSRGEAFIVRERPNEVQLNLTGIARRSSYVITMDVSETLSAPQIQFQSTPSLSNAAILRLLATGSASGGGVGAVGIYLGQGMLGAGGMEDSLSDRLSVDIGEETTSTGRSTVDVKYDLSENTYLEGEYDKYNAYNLDLIWSIFKQ